MSPRTLRQVEVIPPDQHYRVTRWVQAARHRLELPRLRVEPADVVVAITRGALVEQALLSNLADGVSTVRACYATPTAESFELLTTLCAATSSVDEPPTYFELLASPEHASAWHEAWRASTLWRRTLRRIVRPYTFARDELVGLDLVCLRYEVDVPK